MKTRNDLLDYMKNHPWMNRIYKRLNTNEIKILSDFLDQNLLDSRNDFEGKINRLFLGLENKPKRWKEITEILSNINSIREAK